MHQRRNEEEDTPKDKGDTWVSYSDLFTSLSVIFLTMFVFALLQAGLNSIDKVKTQKEAAERLEGKIPKSLKEKMKRQAESLKKTVQDFEVHDNLIDQKVTELNKLSKKVKGHQKLIKDVLLEQGKNTAVIEDLWKKIDSKDEKIKNITSEVAKKEENLIQIKKSFKI